MQDIRIFSKKNDCTKVHLSKKKGYIFRTKYLNITVTKVSTVYSKISCRHKLIENLEKNSNISVTYHTISIFLHLRLTITILSLFPWVLGGRCWFVFRFTKYVLGLINNNNNRVSVLVKVFHYFNTNNFKVQTILHLLQHTIHILHRCWLTQYWNYEFWVQNMFSN